MARARVYDQLYIDSCFKLWYLNGRNTPGSLRRLLSPPSEGIPLPSVSLIGKWMIEGSWDIRADELDARVYQEDDDLLVKKKAQMLREHMEMASRVSKKALEYLMHDGFDTAASAVQAFFRGLEEQRKTAGFSDLLERLEKMTNNDVEKEILYLLQRASDNDQVVDSVAEDVEVREE